MLWKHGGDSCCDCCDTVRDPGDSWNAMISGWFKDELAGIRMNMSELWLAMVIPISIHVIWVVRTKYRRFITVQSILGPRWHHSLFQLDSKKERKTEMMRSIQSMLNILVFLVFFWFVCITIVYRYMWYIVIYIYIHSLYIWQWLTNSNTWCLRQKCRKRYKFTSSSPLKGNWHEKIWLLK